MEHLPLRSSVKEPEKDMCVTHEFLSSDWLWTNLILLPLPLSSFSSLHIPLPEPCHPSESPPDVTNVGRDARAGDALAAALRGGLRAALCCDAVAWLLFILPLLCSSSCVEVGGDVLDDSDEGLPTEMNAVVDDEMGVFAAEVDMEGQL